jgi:hypothetical protein
MRGRGGVVLLRVLGNTRRRPTPGPARERDLAVRAVFAFEDRQFADAISYAAELLLGALGLDVRCVPYEGLAAEPAADLLVSYGWALPPAPPGAADHPQLHFAASGFFGSGFLCPCSLPTGAPVVHEGVPVVFVSPGAGEGWLERQGRRLVTGLDLIASTLFLASRYEEFLRPERDEYGRFETRSAYTYRHGYGQRPLVEEYVDLLRRWLCELGLTIERRRAPGEHEFAIALTHDLDQLTRGWVEAAYHEAKQIRRLHKSAYNISLLIRDKCRGRDPYWSFDSMLGIEEQHGVRSSLYFLPRTGQPKDAHYDWHQDRFGPLFKRLRAGAWEVGLHASYDSGADERMLAEQKCRLEEASGGPVVGVRQHYLRFLVQDGWRRQQEAGFLYDTTLGFADDVGFRGGLARPFRPFDLIARRRLDLWELPLVVMDQTFRTYLGVPVDRVWDRIRPTLEQVKAHRGAAAILWHNTFFAGYKFAGYERVYAELMDWVKANGGVCTTAQEIVAWWAKG